MTDTATPEQENAFVEAFCAFMNETEADAFNSALASFLEHKRLRRFCLELGKNLELETKGPVLSAVVPLLPAGSQSGFTQLNEKYMGKHHNEEEEEEEEEEEAVAEMIESDAEEVAAELEWEKNSAEAARRPSAVPVAGTNRRPSLAGIERSGSMMGGNAYTAENNPLRPTSEPIPLKGHISRMEIPRESLTPLRPIGKGQFGEVYKCMHMGPKGRTPVAVKLALAAKMGAEDREDIKREATCMMYCSHPNVVRILGVCFSQSPWLMVIEYCPEGSLKSLLRMCRSEIELPLTFVEMIYWARQIAEGMKHVCEKGFVHMDVATRNILVKGHRLKVADFGTAHALDKQTRKFRLLHKMKLPVRWMAPETLSGSEIYFSEFSDVYSFGVTVWEIFSYAKLPFGKLSSSEARDVVVKGQVLERPKVCPEDFYENIMRPCWSKDPAERPTFTVLHALIRAEEEKQKAAGHKPRDVASIARKRRGEMRRKKGDGSGKGGKKKKKGARSRTTSTVEVGSTPTKG